MCEPKSLASKLSIFDQFSQNMACVPGDRTITPFKYTDVECKVANLVTEYTGIQVSSNDILANKGLDSLGAIELCNSLAQTFEVTLPSTLLFDHPTIGCVARHIRGLLDLSDRTSVEPDSASPGVREYSDENDHRSCQLQDLMKSCAQKILQTPIDVSRSLISAGLTSSTAFKLSQELSSKIGFQVPSITFFRYSTIYELSGYLQGQELLVQKFQSADPFLLEKKRLIIASQSNYCMSVNERFDNVGCSPFSRWQVGDNDLFSCVPRFGVHMLEIGTFDMSVFEITFCGAIKDGYSTWMLVDYFAQRAHCFGSAP